jgi:hypothetical protein
MVVNVVIDAVIGAIPVAGDLFDVAWRANDWNLALLERHARAGGAGYATSGDWVVVILCAVGVVVAGLLPLLIIWFGFVWLGGHLRALR